MMSIFAGKTPAMIRPQAWRPSRRHLWVWLSLGLICLAAIVALMLIQGIERQLRDVTDTYVVRDTARELSSALSQAEASQRGYLLTNDDRFLEPYHASVDNVNRLVGTLAEMTAEDVAQSARVESIITDISGKMAEMERTLELVANERADDAQRLTETGMGARLMAEVNQTLADFIGEEDQKLAARNRAIDQTRMGLVIVLIAALAAAVILANALLSRTQRQVSDLTRRQSGLLSQNEALEAEVRERTRDIEEARAHAEHERQRVETLLQDSNHRIGNSLTAVSSLLTLQAMRTQSTEVREALEAARSRVHAVASAHRRLRLAEDFESANANEFLGAVVEDIGTTLDQLRRITLRSDLAPIVVSARDATTLGILVGELITNALKHAFPDSRGGIVDIRLYRDGKGIPTLSVRDDGIGLSDAATLSHEQGLGSVIVRQLAGQFGGEPRYRSPADGGTEISIELAKLAGPAGPPQQETT